MRPEGAVLLTVVRTGAGARARVTGRWVRHHGSHRQPVLSCPRPQRPHPPNMASLSGMWPVTAAPLCGSPGGHCGITLCPWKRSRKSMTFTPSCPTKSAVVCGLVRVGHLPAETVFLTCGLPPSTPRRWPLSPPCCPAPFSSSAHRDPLGDPRTQPSLSRTCGWGALLCPPPLPGGSVSPWKPWLTSPPLFSFPVLRGGLVAHLPCPHGRPSVLLTTPVPSCFGSSVYMAGSSRRRGPPLSELRHPGRAHGGHTAGTRRALERQSEPVGCT